MGTHLSESHRPDLTVTSSMITPEERWAQRPMIENVATLLEDETLFARELRAAIKDDKLRRQIIETEATQDGQ